MAWMAFGNWTEQIVNFAVFTILARLLGAEAFGLVAMAVAFVILCEFLVRESVSEYLIAAHDPGPADLNAVFWLLVALGAGLSAVLAAVAVPIAEAYGQPEVAPMIWWLTPTILMIAPTAVPVAVLRRSMRFEILSIRAVAGYVAGGIAGVAMAVSGYGVWSLVGQRLAQIGVDSALAWFGAHWLPRMDVRGADLRRILHFGGQVLGLRAAELAMVQTPIVVTGALIGPVAAGYYALAWRLVETLSHLIVTPIRTAAQPAFAAMRRAGARPGDMLIDALRIATLVLYPAFLGLALVSGPLLVAVFGADWGAAAPALVALSAFGLLLSFDKLQQVFGLALGQIGRFTLLTWVSVGLMVVLTPLVAHWGIAAVAWASLVALALPGAVRMLIILQIGGLSLADLLRPHGLPLVSAVAMGLAVAAVLGTLVGASPLTLTASAVMAGMAIYALATLGFMRDRIGLLRQLVRGDRARPQT